MSHEQAPYRRGDVIEVAVTGHAHYGVLVTVPTGERGWIESHYLDDARVAQQDWPERGSVLDAVVLGPQTRDGRWRLTTRPTALVAARAGQEI